MRYTLESFCHEIISSFLYMPFTQIINTCSKDGVLVLVEDNTNHVPWIIGEFCLDHSAAYEQCFAVTEIYYWSIRVRHYNATQLKTFMMRSTGSTKTRSSL